LTTWLRGDHAALNLVMGGAILITTLLALV
jgi:hypothetical protein